MSPTYDYDVAVTFAGEDRQFVSGVVERVKAAGYTVFYDQDEQVELWGEDLTEYFPKIYEQRCRYAVMFVSRHYAAKPWTRLERRSILVRALEQDTPYLLPVRLDATELPGVRSSIRYLDAQTFGSSGVADALFVKLGSAPAASGGRFNGYVPRNAHEAATLVGERPRAWEYLLYSYALVDSIEKLSDAYLDHQIGYAEPHDVVDRDSLDAIVRRGKATILSTVHNFSELLSISVQQSAFGVPGQPGDVDVSHLFGGRHTCAATRLRLTRFVPCSGRSRGSPTSRLSDYGRLRITSARGPISSQVSLNVASRS